MFRHPSYYKELRKRNKSDQAISKEQPDGVHTSVRPGPGQQADKPTSQQADKPTSEQADKPASAQASSGSRINKRSI